MSSFLPLDTDGNVRSQYDYVPTEWICIMFLGLFSLSAFVHAIQAIKYRLWWLLITACVAGLLEIAGWSARLWSSLSPTLKDPFIMQMVTTVIAPYRCQFHHSGAMIRRVGENYSRLSAKWCSIIFVGCDLISLTVQAAGGAQAASASTLSASNLGGNVMLGGIAFQLLAITFYSILAVEFFWRYICNKPLRPSEKHAEMYDFDNKMNFMMLGLALTSFSIYIRSIYRLIELSDGWHGIVIQTQVYFNIFDAGMITFAMYMLNIFHPGLLLGPGKVWKAYNKGPKTDEEAMSELHSLKAEAEKY